MLHILDRAFDPCDSDLAGHPEGPTMDGGAWLPLRTRYLPRWHHTGSYQLYPGEHEAAPAPAVSSEASSRKNHNIDRRSFYDKNRFSQDVPVPPTPRTNP